MKIIRIPGLLVVLLAAGTLLGQSLPTPSLASPVNMDIGIGGGATLPSGKLSDANNTGWHAGGKIRLHGFMPLSIVALGNYHRLPNKVGSESDTEVMIGAGLEYPIPSVMVKPYFGVDATVNIFSNTGPGPSSTTRQGIGVGVGVEFTVPAFGSFDTSVKYQMLNLIGKENNEEGISQISANLAIMFSVL